MAPSNLSGFCCPCPECPKTFSASEGMVAVIAHTNEMHNNITPFARCCCPYLACKKVFRNVKPLSIHLLSHVRNPSPNIDAPHEGTLSGLSTISDAPPAGPSPFPLPARTSAVRYRDCATCKKQKRRCRIHTDTVSMSTQKRIPPRTACAGCKCDKKQCHKGPSCSRCGQLGRPCFGDDTYRAVIESRCNQLTSINDGDIMQAIRDLKCILWIGDVERRTKRPRINANINRYALCIQEYNGVQLLRSLEVRGDPVATEIRSVIGGWFPDSHEQ